LPVAAALALIRPEEDGFRRDGAMLLLGLAVGTLLANDAWYFAPVTAALAPPLVAWHFRWHLWSRSRWLVPAVLALVLTVLAGAALDFHNLVPEFDNRFSLGLSRTPNFILTLAGIAAFLALLGAWGGWHWRHADAQNRALLADIIAREPRCSRYFDAVARLTPFGSDRKSSSPSRFPPVVSGPDDAAPPLDPLFEDLSRWRPSMFAHWKVGYALAGQPWLVPLSRFLRTAGRSGEFPSTALRELLTEALQREHQMCLAKLTGANGNGAAADLFARFQPAPSENQGASNGEWRRWWGGLRRMFVSAESLSSPNSVKHA
jgi:hypothetical protein